MIIYPVGTLRHFGAQKRYSGGIIILYLNLKLMRTVKRLLISKPFLIFTTPINKVQSKKLNLYFLWTSEVNIRVYFEYDMMPFWDFSAAFPIITRVQNLSWPTNANKNPIRTTKETNCTTAIKIPFSPWAWISLSPLKSWHAVFCTIERFQPAINLEPSKVLPALLDTLLSSSTEPRIFVLPITGLVRIQYRRAYQFFWKIEKTKKFLRLRIARC